MDKPDDYVLATGKTTSIREFLRMSFEVLGIVVKFEGDGVDEVAVVVENKKNMNVKIGQIVTKVNPYYFRPTEVDLLIGDPTKAKKILGWENKINLEQMIKEMVEYDFKVLKKI